MIFTKQNAIPLLIGILIILLCLCVVPFAWKNRGNSTVVTSSVTLIAAIVFFLLNTWVSLNGSKSVNSFAIEITIDRSNNFIGSHVYSMAQTTRLNVEKVLRDKLNAENPTLMSEQENVVLRDFLLASVVGWLAGQEYDWQSRGKGAQNFTNDDND